MKTNYEKQANDFLLATGCEIEISFLKNDFHFTNDKEKRDIYAVKIKRGNRVISFNFGNSLNNSGFYFTMGRKKIEIDRKYLSKENRKNLMYFIRMELAGDFLNNGNSDIIHYPKEPTAYDIIACLTKYDPGTFENFCSEYGYDEDSRTAYKTYQAVCKEWADVCKIWSDDEIEKLAEIQ